MEPDQILEIVVHVIAICSVIAAITPTPVDNAILLAVRKVIDAGALNVLFAKNKGRK
jgi:hypothetical protein